MIELIIDIAYFEINTVIDTDFDSDKAYNHLIEAHEIQTFELLGEELYNRVQTALAGTPTPIETELIDKLKPFVLKATELDFIPFLNNPVTAKGTQDRSGNNTTPANDINQGLIIQNVRAKVEVYAIRVRDFLDKNTLSFPEWNCTKDGNFYSSIYGV